VATGSLALSSALVFALIAISEGVERQLGRELRAYGANLLVLPRQAPLRFGLGAYELGSAGEERTLELADLARLGGDLVDGVVPGLVLRLQVDGVDAGAVGFDLASLHRMNPMWRVAPGWPIGGGALAGATLAGRLRLSPGQVVEVVAGGRRGRIAVEALVETGGGEDENLFLPLPFAQDLAARQGQVSFALVRARLAGRSADNVARAVEAMVPGTEARTIRQVASAEAALLAKVRRLLLLVTLALGAATAFTVAGTLGVLLLARRTEIGLLLALGASPAQVRGLLLAEAAVAGLLGGLAGCALGAAAAEAVARGVFGLFVPLALAAAPLALATSLAVALGAAVWPVYRAVRVSPCDSLRSA